MVHFGSFWLIWLIMANFGSFWFILVHFGSIWFILVHLVHLVDALIAILDNFTIKKSRKYFIETKTFIVLQNLFGSVREKLVVRKRILVKI